ncbi:MAG: hypothetical protein OXU35_00315 [Acidobacteriota bacterium]|nr:hypothetical protein [Acidobacteriota bacterium]
MTIARGLQSDAFAWLIAPMCTDIFERDFYERALCFVPRTDPDYYAGLLSFEDLDVVLGTCNVTPSVIGLVRGNDNIPRSAFVHASGGIDPLAVAKMFDDGATITFNQLHRYVPVLSEFCASIGRAFSSRVQTNIYLTPPQAQGFKPHWDTHDVFVLQVSGRKHWSVYDTKVTLPLKGQAFEPESDLPGPVAAEFDLGPGECVYIPRGLMHSARSTTEVSLHITLGITSFTWVNFLVESVAATALRDESLRRSLPMRFADGSIPPEALDGLVRDKLERLSSRLDPTEVWDHFRSELMVLNAPLFTDLLTSRVSTGDVTLDSKLRRRNGLFVTTKRDPERCCLCFCGSELQFPSSTWPAIAFISVTPAFTVRDLPDCPDGEGKLTVVKRLVREGLLQPDGHP